MNENEAYHAVGLLIGGVKIWPEAANDAFIQTFMKHVDDAEAMTEVCERIALGWGDRDGRPSIGEVLDEYRAHPRVTAEREARTAAALASTASGTHCTGDGVIGVIESDGERRQRPCPRCKPGLAEIYADPDKWAKWRNGTPAKDLLDPDTAGLSTPSPCKVDTIHDPEYRVPTSFAEGRAIGGDEYRSLYGRAIGDSMVANPVYAADIIMRDGTFDPLREVWRATYSDVANGFNQDHARAIASLHALGRRLTHDNSGKLALRPPSEPAAPPPAATDPPPPPPERPPDASGLLAEALGETRRRMEGER